MLSFDPRALMAPGGVINGAGNAIAALAGVPAQYRQAQEMQRRNSLAVQALKQKGTEQDREFGLKKSAQDYNQDPTNPANAHLSALDKNMTPGMTYEQRLEIAKTEHPPAAAKSKKLEIRGDGFGGMVIFDPETGQQVGHTNDYAPGAVHQQPQGAQPPAVQALTAPQVPGGRAAMPTTDPAGRAQHKIMLAQKVMDGTATPQEQAEFEGLDQGAP